MLSKIRPFCHETDRGNGSPFGVSEFDARFVGARFDFVGLEEVDDRVIVVVDPSGRFPRRRGDKGGGGRRRGVRNVTAGCWRRQGWRDSVVPVVG